MIAVSEMSEFFTYLEVHGLTTRAFQMSTVATQETIVKDFREWDKGECNRELEVELLNDMDELIGYLEDIQGKEPWVVNAHLENQFRRMIDDVVKDNKRRISLWKGNK
jgi:hypothetical protein